MNAATTPTASTTVPHPRDPLLETLRWFIRGNYFYVISALLMMLGCYLLMQSMPNTGDNFRWTLKALLWLQAYELLVIATAALIVWRLRILSDAATLLLIELALLLDPTFFTNSFYTLRTAESAWVNVGCLLLVPFKLAILQICLRLRVSPRAWFAFLAAASLIYLAPMSMVHDTLSAYRMDILYLMAWGAFLVAALMPPLERSLRFKKRNAGAFHTPAQARAVRLGLVFLPTLVVCSHVATGAIVYELPLRLMHFSPLLLALAVLRTTNSGAGRRWDASLIPIDVLGVLALVLSMGSANPGFEKVYMLGQHPPVIYVGLVLAGMYLLYYRRMDYTPALYRVAAMIFMAVLYLLIRGGLITAAGNLTLNAGHATMDFIHAHPALIQSIMLAGLLAIAYRWRHAVTWLAAGAFVIYYAFRFGPVQIPSAIPELFQAILWLLALLWHRFTNDYRSTRQVVALALIAALARFWIAPLAWPAVPMIVEIAFVLIVALWLSNLWYRNLGLLAMAAILGTYVWLAAQRMTAAMAVVTLGVLIFAIGVVVTFWKEWLLQRLEMRGNEPVVELETDSEPVLE